ncbi:RsbR, positive regulator of sigma-B [Fictibacillus sp. KIGAM418]|uniref:RsbR, positive regulator of sigma-B n=1 Tax=Fictibacillus marinisediminis TaxID=2878389 RepID=A0A9X1XDU4_9BACL|nr:STAS domain-containing protein [Fictibacillus marinisediminis]MCK6259042.1 RsbR, positive regulator of sigma-B [Fictibacillus marinisediminis]
MHQVPFDLSSTDVLNSIGEVIILADKEYKIIWMNIKAKEILGTIAPYYGLSSSDDFIGLNMDYFHNKPDHQRRVMGRLEGGHRARINIKDKVIADIVITPIRKEQGFMVMLMDVTSKVEEDKRKERLIKDLSVPILNIWDRTIALTLIGSLEIDRGEHIITTVLEECVNNGVRFVMVSLRGITTFDDSVRYNLTKLYDCLNLIGVECVIVGINPELAMNIQELNHIPTFKDAHAGLKYIISFENNN